MYLDIMVSAASVVLVDWFVSNKLGQRMDLSPQQTPFTSGADPD